VTSNEDRKAKARIAWRAAKHAADAAYGKAVEPTRTRFEAAKVKARAAQRKAHDEARDVYRRELESIARSVR
jgi:hypothetical protein